MIIRENFIKDIYVIEDLEARLYKTHSFEKGNLADAIEMYNKLPSCKMKALGLNRIKGGALDFIQCVNGKDKLCFDYKKVPGWDSSEEVKKIAEMISYKIIEQQARNIIEDSNIPMEEELEAEF